MVNLVAVLFWSLFITKALAFIPQVPFNRMSQQRQSDFFGDDLAEEVQQNPNQVVPRFSNEELEAMAPEWANHVPKFSRITLVGRVGNDPDPKYFDNGKVVLNLSLAVRRKYHPLERRALKIQEDATDWFNLELWGRDAEYAAKYVNKGARIGVSGSLAVDSWVDREGGDKRSKCTVIVNDLDILESKAEAELRRGSQQSFKQQGATRRKSFYTEDDKDDDDEFLGPHSAGTGGFF
jgi:single-strand DNA-binding protein